MKRLILISAVCMQFGWISGVPHPSGVGAYAYQDSNGNSHRVARSPLLPPLPPLPPLLPFRPLPPLPPLPPLLPFRPLPPLLPFRPLRPLPPLRRFAPFGGMPGFGNFAAFGNNDNSAFASGVAAPGYTHQTAAISPGNPNTPNVDVTQRFSDGPGAGNYMSVSSSSYSASTNNNGMPSSHRVAETLVNNNGKVTHYKVEN
ncbi:uncharacterized protein isoform X2 [Choristoneura fumiferana]|uniref:uncharacterized protein isoform X2 n=1 Tax=Choristoneura fumiferana TaxID=7141 RepID=UPI003D15E4BA